MATETSKTLQLSSTKKGRLRPAVWLILWITLIATGVNLLRLDILDTYADYEVSSYAELKGKVGHRYNSPDEGVFWSHVGCDIGGLILLLLAWGLLDTVFAWRSTIELQLDEEGFATSIRSGDDFFPWGHSDSVRAVERIKRVHMGQRTIDRMMGVGTVIIEVSTFVMNTVTDTTYTINGVVNPADQVTRLHAAIRPHQGMLLAHNIQPGEGLSDLVE